MIDGVRDGGWLKGASSEVVVAARFHRTNEEGGSVGGGRQPSQRFPKTTNHYSISK